MALIVKIQANHRVLSVVSAQRVEGGESPDDLNTYKITSVDYREDPAGKHHTHGSIRHRYGDPADVLALRALSFSMLHGEEENR
jgi:hypothetical protein